MPRYRIHRLRDVQQEQFRWAPHTSGTAVVRPKDYREEGRVEAASPYAAWFLLRERGTPLRVGDLLESDEGELLICKYVGFEAARWEPVQPPGGQPVDLSADPSSSAS
ncbi:MAG: hypothetical protein RMI94_03165 [Bryobacterales bacterium]|nr:hypothetical protein [Bryobacteraceae bacterium]MDW8129522.1 hypothetical protein [Bryobacterales bacterium]